MPFLVALLVIALIIAFLFLSTLFIVPQQQAYIIERFGKFNKVQFAGIHIRIPFVDRIAMKTNMRVNQLSKKSRISKPLLLKMVLLRFNLGIALIILKN